MSIATIRKIFHTELATVSPSIATVHENEAYSPAVGTPYQEAYVLPAQPDNIEIGPGYVEQGIYQANLFYPKDKGAGAAITQAALIRAHFPFGASFSSGGVTVNIIATPEIGPARPEDDRFMVPVRTRFRAHIGG